MATELVTLFADATCGVTADSAQATVGPLGFVVSVLILMQGGG